MLIEFLRSAAGVSHDPDQPSFQVIINTHSPKVMEALLDSEIVAADSVSSIDTVAKQRSIRTRMRTGIRPAQVMFDPEVNLTRYEVEKLLQHATDAA